MLRSTPHMVEGTMIKQILLVTLVMLSVGYPSEGPMAARVDPNRALQLAVKAGNQKEIEAAIDRGANINAVVEGLSMLDLAVLTKPLDIVAELLSHGANVNYRNEVGITAIYEAIILNRLDVARLFIAYGADLNNIDNEGQTPLQYAQSMERKTPNCCLEMIAILGGAAPAPQASQSQPLPSPIGTPTAPSNGATPPSTGSSYCLDTVRRLYQEVKQAKPDIDPVAALDAVNMLLPEAGCPSLKTEQNSQTTQCSWVGFYWTCTAK